MSAIPTPRIGAKWRPRSRLPRRDSRAGGGGRSLSASGDSRATTRSDPTRRTRATRSSSVGPKPQACRRIAEPTGCPSPTVAVLRRSETSVAAAVRSFAHWGMPARLIRPVVSRRITISSSPRGARSRNPGSPAANRIQIRPIPAGHHASSESNRDAERHLQFIRDTLDRRIIDSLAREYLGGMT